jgi:hypothetical protein
VRNVPSTEDEDLTADTADDPKATTTYRALKAVVIILGVLIVLALGALVVGGAMKLAGHHGSGQVAASAVAGSLPLGARIISLQADGDRLIVGVHAPGGDEVDIFDSETGRLVARIRPAQAGGLK